MMQVIAKDTGRTEELQRAVLLYNNFATIHDVTQDGARRPVIGAGKLATTEALVGALKSLLPKEEQGTGFIEDTLLAKGVGYMMWWVKPRHRSVSFSATEFGGERGAVVPNPGLVMLNRLDNWSVFAVKGNQRPTLDTELFQAPYFNVNRLGLICQGNITLPQGGQATQPEAWNTVFFGSFFTHPNVREHGRLVKGDCYKFWKDMLDGKYSKFPERYLVSSERTVGKLLQDVGIGRGE